MRENKKYLTEMNEFVLSDFEQNQTVKYKSCVTYERTLSSDILTRLYNNGWKLVNFNGFSKSQTIGSFIKEGCTLECYAYMFENMNYPENQNINE